jgi:membrane-associated phospholipid phosphatase
MVKETPSRLGALRYRIRPVMKPVMMAKLAREEVAGGARELLARRYHVAVTVMALGFGVLALLARTIAYFSVDLELTRAVQGAGPPWLGGLLGAVTWIGFPPQSNVIFGAVIVGLVLIGYRPEGLMTAVAAVGSAGLWFLIVPLVDRPRPSPELVDVAMHLPTGSFPSGHVVNLTAIFGFLIYLTLLLIPSDWVRWPLVLILPLPIFVIGFARIEDGAHWPSDVLGGYMLGSVWLAITTQLYRWAQRRFRKKSGFLAYARSASHPSSEFSEPGRSVVLHLAPAHRHPYTR